MPRHGDAGQRSPCISKSHEVAQVAADLVLTCRITECKTSTGILIRFADTDSGEGVSEEEGPIVHTYAEDDSDDEPAPEEDELDPSDDEASSSDNEPAPSDDEDDLEKSTRRKASKRDRDLDKWIKLVFVPRVRKISKPRPYWASLSAKADDPQCNMTLKEFTWSFTEILRSQPHAWRIP